MGVARYAFKQAHTLASTDDAVNPSMNQTVAIALVALVEIVLVLAVVTGLLIFRMRRMGRAAPAEAGEAPRDHLARQLEETASWEGEDESVDAIVRNRHRAVEAEITALDTEDAAARRSMLARAYGPSEKETELTDENERLTRLLQRENNQLRDLLELRDRFQDLWLRYDRVRRLVEQIDETADPETIGKAVVTFRKAEGAWSEAMTGFARRLEAVAGTPEQHTDDAPDEPVAASARSMIEQQTDAVAALKEELADTDAENARALVDNLQSQLQEMEMCVQVLEDENRMLADSVRRETLPDTKDDTGRQSDAELDQVIAMKDRQIAELRERLGLPPED